MKNVESKVENLFTIRIENKLTFLQMENLVAGGSTNRKCLIDGMLTAAGVALGGAVALWGGAAGALLAGLYAGNANGCFS
ncbi:MAG: hypothetical protein ABIP27_10315 [Flavobacterium circumlabens]|uniref:hypothetical protein n=1 Tax=Flavobacterium circumlabens TaxID=2133765 RepID=UPI0032637FC6